MCEKLSQKSALFEPLDFSQIPGWESDDHLQALNTLYWSAKRAAKKTYKTKSLGVDANALNIIYSKILDKAFNGFNSKQSAKTFFEHNFQPHLIIPNDGLKKPANKNSAGKFNGFVTAYFEPEVEASTTQTKRFKYPIFKRPTDLVAITDRQRPSSMEESFFFARKTETNNVVEYKTFPNRQQIETGALDGQALEIYWLESRVDIFFVHIQGSARLVIKNGAGRQTIERISYDGKSGHAFTPIGKILIERGEIERENVTMQSIRDWLYQHPDKADAMMHENESFIFFQKIDHPEPTLGPVAAAGVPLTPNRSLAVDHKLQTFGVPIFISTKTPIGNEAHPFQKLMIAQDTGSAIVGAARGDLFIGTGEGAGKIAGGVKHQADFIVFLPCTNSSPCPGDVTFDKIEADKNAS